MRALIRTENRSGDNLIKKNFDSSSDPATGEQWLEAHKLPKEQWFKEADGLASVRRQAAAKRAAAAVSSYHDEM